MKGQGRQRSRNQRIFGILLLISGLFAIWLMRLGWLQLAPPSLSLTASKQTDWEQIAVHQRERSLVLDTGRGDFVDRSGRALTGESYQALAVFPLQASARGSAAALNQLASVLGVSPEPFKLWLNELREPKFWQREGVRQVHALTNEQLKVISGLKIDGIRVLPYRNRYPQSFLARHAIGYIAQHPEHIQSYYAEDLAAKRRKLTDLIGGAGLERALEPLLRGAGPTAALYFTDGQNKPLHGLDVRFTGPSNPYYPLKIVTTIDASIQEQIERYVDKQGLKEGAVVVLDASNGDIVAMASRPQLSPFSLGAPGSDLANHAIRAVAPGSIFKIVTEAAALEAGATHEHEQFQCSGHYGKYGLKCWKAGGHGKLTLREALAQSCNVAFATLAERLSPQSFVAAADKLGIGRQIGWEETKSFAPLEGPLRMLQEEEAGKVFAALQAQRDGGQLAQTGIGQRDVRMSPLQAANMVVTLLHDGIIFAPRLVSEIRYANDQLMVKLPVHTAPSKYGAISSSTAQTILKGMEWTVKQGTGKAIQNGIWQVAGKSGTAETGIARNHQWFTGYGPTEAPRYVVAVLAENRLPNTTNQATRLFRGIMDILARSGSS